MVRCPTDTSKAVITEAVVRTGVIKLVFIGIKALILTRTIRTGFVDSTSLLHSQSFI